MEKKNIFLLAMSTFNLENKKLIGNYFSYPDSKELHGPMYGQLEPISRMLIEMGICPDRIIVLCTEESLKQVDYEMDGEACRKSPYENYKERILRLLPDRCASDLFCMVRIDQNNINPGIIEAATHIKEASKGCESVNLWVDTQGGFRNISLAINAIINLLSIRQINLVDIYSIDFNGRNMPAPIKKQTENYKIFDFVSGIKEFISYGRGDQLEKYYENRECSEQTRSVVNSIKNLADAIQLCDPIAFEKHLNELFKSIGNYQNNDDAHDELFSIFIEEVKADYGKLLTGNYTKLDVAEWCLQKQFYQQALTFIVDALPEELVKMRLFYWETMTETSLDAVKEYSVEHKEEKIENYVLIKYISKGKQAHLCSLLAKNSNVTSDSFEAIIKDKYKKCIKSLSANDYEFDIVEKRISGDEIESKACTISIKSACTSQDELHMFLYLYKLLKNERNLFNHFSDKVKRAEKNDIIMAIELFLKLGKKLYGELPAITQVQ